MSKSIPVVLNPTTAVEIDASIVAEGLELPVTRFRQLMEHRKITLLCERGTGEDIGLFRATFYHGRKRVRLVVDRNGNPVAGHAG